MEFFQKITYNFDFALSQRTFSTSNFKLVVCISRKLSVESNCKCYSPNDTYTISPTRVSQKLGRKALGGWSTTIVKDLDTDPNHLSHLISHDGPPTTHSEPRCSEGP